MAIHNTDATRERARTSYRNTHHVANVKDLPTNPTIPAVLVQQQHYSHDDGYGSPSRTDYVQIIKFDTIEALEDWVIENQDKQFQITKLQAVPHKIKALIDLTIGD